MTPFPFPPRFRLLLVAPRMRLEDRVLITILPSSTSSRWPIPYQIPLVLDSIHTRSHSRPLSTCNLTDDAVVQSSKPRISSLTAPLPLASPQEAGKGSWYVPRSIMPTYAERQPTPRATISPHTPPHPPTKRSVRAAVLLPLQQHARLGPPSLRSGSAWPRARLGRRAARHSGGGTCW